MRTDTPLLALADALTRATPGSAHWYLLAAAEDYAADHPEWFEWWAHYQFATEGFASAAEHALGAGDKVASLTLHAVAELAHPENDTAGLFGGPR